VTTFETGQLAREAVRAGHGITIMPEPIVAPDIASGALIALCTEQDSKIAYHALTRKEVVSPGRDTFVRWLLAQSKTS